MIIITKNNNNDKYKKQIEKNNSSCDIEIESWPSWLPASPIVMYVTPSVRTVPLNIGKERSYAWTCPDTTKLTWFS